MHGAGLRNCALKVRKVPWLKKLPSEYVRDHVWLTTQPLEISPKREQVAELLGWVNGADRLCYSSDYPHWDFDDPNLAFRFQMTEDEKRMLFRDNALDVYTFR